MKLIHAWFSAETAIRNGSSVYRKPSGSTVNVTRVDAEKPGGGSHPQDEKYMGEVVCDEEGGRVQANRRV